MTSAYKLFIKVFLSTHFILSARKC